MIKLNSLREGKAREIVSRLMGKQAEMKLKCLPGPWLMKTNVVQSLYNTLWDNPATRSLSPRFLRSYTDFLYPLPSYSESFSRLIINNEIVISKYRK